MADGSHSSHGWKIATALFALLAIGASICSFTQYRTASGLAQQLATLTAASDSFKTQLGYAEASATDLTRQLAMAREQLQSESRPDLPVLLGFRGALLGGGKVAMIRNLSKSTIEIIVEAQSPVTGAHFRRSVVINPLGQAQVGPAQGWSFASGQTISLSNPNYRPLTKTVS
jgi:hypothetical protein